MRAIKALVTYLLSFLPANKRLIEKHNRIGGGT